MLPTTEVERIVSCIIAETAERAESEGIEDAYELALEAWTMDLSDEGFAAVLSRASRARWARWPEAA
jgi:hypothetical protein